jgi:hypothetical protein
LSIKTRTIFGFFSAEAMCGFNTMAVPKRNRSKKVCRCFIGDLLLSII